MTPKWVWLFLVIFGHVTVHDYTVLPVTVQTWNKISDTRLAICGLSCD